MAEIGIPVRLKVKMVIGGIGGVAIIVPLVLKVVGIIK